MSMKCRVIEGGLCEMTQGYHSNHIAYDLVNKGYTLGNIVAHSDGVVIATRNNCNKVYSNVNSAILDWGDSYGNYVLIKHGTLYSFYAHLKHGSVCVNVGQTVKAGQKIGYMGNTGNTAGGHLHFEIRTSESWQSAIDPTPYFNEDLAIKLPTPVERNTNVNQVAVICGENTLRVRTGHSTNSSVIGFATAGIYNIVSKFEDGTYTWYEVEAGKWFASAEGCTQYLPYVEEEPVIDVLEPQEDEKKEDNTNTPEEDEKAENKPNNDEIEDNTSIDIKNKDKENVILWLITLIINLIRKIFKKN